MDNTYINSMAEEVKEYVIISKEKPEPIINSMANVECHEAANTDNHEDR